VIFDPSRACGSVLTGMGSIGAEDAADIAMSGTRGWFTIALNAVPVCRSGVTRKSEVVGSLPLPARIVPTTFRLLCHRPHSEWAVQHCHFKTEYRDSAEAINDDLLTVLESFDNLGGNVDR
jgi:hypothetical protein